jgi:hypothetical protein
MGAPRAGGVEVFVIGSQYQRVHGRCGEKRWTDRVRGGFQEGRMEVVLVDGVNG